MAERFVDVIQKKKNGQELTEEEIIDMISGYTMGAIPDYQMSSMLMAICFQGMTNQELSILTREMTESGDTVDLSAIDGVKVDKHSTGGVGDKTTLILGPIVASAGIPVAKMSGMGLGFTGGTIDKLQSIPGFSTEVTKEDFVENVNRIGICVAGQSTRLAPADRRLYALRDVTATVESIPLIASSIMSKKIAAGSDKIVLDVTTGSGAFIKDLEGSKELATRMVAIGNANGKETIAVITNMDEPLGYAVGNNLEVKEAIETLKGNGPEDLLEVCYALAGNMIYLAKKEEQKDFSYEDGVRIAKEELESGRAYKKFLEFAKNQGGDISYIENPEKFEKAEKSLALCAKEEGYIYQINTAEVGVSSGMLGAGRETKESIIDMSAGIVFEKKTGDLVKKGDVIATLYAKNDELLNNACKHLEQYIFIKNEKPEKLKMIVEQIGIPFQDE